MYMAMINIHNIHNNMYYSINLYVHSSDPSIHRYGTHICQSFFSPMETVLSPLPILLPPPILSDSPTFEVSILVTIPACLSAMNDAGSPTIFITTGPPTC